MTIDIPSALAKVRELNSKRTPGLWFQRNFRWITSEKRNDLAECLMADQGYKEAIGNAAFIANIPEMVDLIEAMAAEREALIRDRDHWKANHDNQVDRARLLIERTDMPVERVKAYQLVEEQAAQIAELVAERDARAAVSVWRPIETAPLDGMFLAWCEGLPIEGDHRFPTADLIQVFHAKTYWASMADDAPAFMPRLEAMQAKYWMPLPAPPATGGEEG